MPPRNSTFAIFSGYEMSPQDFKEFVSSIPAAVEAVDWVNSPNFMTYIFAYDAFRRRLPQKMAGSAPKLRVRYVSKEASQLSGSAYEAGVAGLFFRIRFVKYKGRRQLLDSHPDSQRIRDETPEDRAKLLNFVQFVESRGGKLDPTKVSFAFMKDLHPAYDWKNF